MKQNTITAQQAIENLKLAVARLEAKNLAATVDYLINNEAMAVRGYIGRTLLIDRVFRLDRDAEKIDSLSRSLHRELLSRSRILSNQEQTLNFSFSGAF